VEIGKPIITVALNHRLNSIGTTASPELGASGNYLLKDERAGMEWVQKYISSFGGDEKNVTLFGESAGAGGFSLLFELLLRN
jgi:carboxylesterase type B